MIDDIDEPIEQQNQRRLASFLKFVLEADRLLQREGGPYRATISDALARAAAMGCLLAVYRQGRAIAIGIFIPTTVEAVTICGKDLGFEGYDAGGRVLYAYYGLVSKKHRHRGGFEELLRTAHRNFPRAEAVVFHRTLKDNGTRLHILDFDRKGRAWAATSEERSVERSGRSVSASRAKANGRRASADFEAPSPMPSTS